MTIQVNGVKEDSIVDTGAEVTLLSEDFFNSVGLPDRLSDCPEVQLHNAEEGANMTGHKVLVNLQLGSHMVKWPVYVAPIREKILLGLDLLQEADVSIRARGSVYVKGQRVKSKIIARGQSHVTAAVRLENKVVLQPNTEHIVWGEVDCPYAGKEAVLTPVLLPPTDVYVAATLVNMDHRVPIRIANFSSRPVPLEAGILLGDLVE